MVHFPKYKLAIVIDELGHGNRNIEESTKKILIDEFSNKLLGLEFKSHNSIKTKCLKFVVKNIL